MSKKPGLRWKLYFFFYFPITIGGVIALLSSDSSIYMHYHIAMVFSEKFVIPYILNLLSALFNLIIIIPLFLFAFHIKFLSRRVWQGLFFLRLGFDLVGHAYEVLFIKSAFYADIGLGISAVFILFLIIAPSYWATFRYAFQQKKLFEF